MPEPGAYSAIKGPHSGYLGKTTVRKLLISFRLLGLVSTFRARTLYGGEKRPFREEPARIEGR